MTKSLTDTERINRLQELVDEHNAILLHNQGDTRGFTGVAGDAEVRP